MLSIGVLIAHVACAVAAALHAFDQQPLVDHEDGNGKVDLIHEYSNHPHIVSIVAANLTSNSQAHQGRDYTHGSGLLHASPHAVNLLAKCYR